MKKKIKNPQRKMPFSHHVMHNLPLLCVIVAALFLRLWNAGEFFSFNFDEEYQATLAWSIVKDFHVIWIGVSASNVGYYLGPGFTYLNALLFWLKNGDPITLAYFSSLFGVVTCISIFYVVKSLYSQQVAYFSTIIYAFSAFVNYFDRRFWNPTPIPFISIWLLYGLVKMYENSKWLILVSTLMAASLHVHLSLMLFWPIVLWVTLVNFKKISLKTWILSMAVFILITSPLLVFDFVHNFDNLLAPIRFVQDIQDPHHTPSVSAIGNHTRVFLSTLGRIWHLKLGTNIQEEHNLGAHGGVTSAHPLISYLSLGALLWMSIKGLKIRTHRLLLATILVLTLGFVVYPGIAGEYYQLGAVTLIIVAYGLFFSTLPRLLAIMLLSVFIIFNVLTIFTTTHENRSFKKL